MKIDLNCDIGETYYQNEIGNDAEILPLVSSCNIACGFHGGDPLTIQKTIDLALQNNVNIGAHPSFPDLKNFGRTYMKLSKEELQSVLRYQIGAVKTMTENSGGVLKHIKPHGALYNAAATDFELAIQIVEVVQEFGSQLCFLGMVNSEMEKASNFLGVPFVKEAFVDRLYLNSNTLVSRSESNAVFKNADQVLNQALSIAKQEAFLSQRGKQILLKTDSLCIHGDTENALFFVEKLRAKFSEDSIHIKPF